MLGLQTTNMADEATEKHIDISRTVFEPRFEQIVVPRSFTHRIGYGINAKSLFMNWRILGTEQNEKW